MGAPGALHGRTVHHLGAGPALGGAKDDHRPARALGPVEAVGPSVGLDALDVVADRVESPGQELMHRPRLIALDEIGGIAVTAEELVQLLVADPGEDRRPGDLVAVEV